MITLIKINTDLFIKNRNNHHESHRDQWKPTQKLEHGYPVEENARRCGVLGAETEIVYLYDLTFRGCVSCLACKLQNGKSLGRCVLKDDLSPVLARLHEADAAVMGSPIYFSEVTGEMRCFIERFVFQYLNYDNFSQPLSPAKKTAMIYTMNCPEELLDKIGYTAMFKRYEDIMIRFFGNCTTLLSTNTMQVKDYSRYHLGAFDADAKKLRHETVFPQDCQKAFDLGVQLATSK